MLAGNFIKNLSPMFHEKFKNFGDKYGKSMVGTNMGFGGQIWKTTGKYCAFKDGAEDS